MRQPADGSATPAELPLLQHEYSFRVFGGGRWNIWGLLSVSSRLCTRRSGPVHLRTNHVDLLSPNLPTPSLFCDFLTSFLAADHVGKLASFSGTSCVALSHVAFAARRGPPPSPHRRFAANKGTHPNQPAQERPAPCHEGFLPPLK